MRCQPGKLWLEDCHLTASLDPERLHQHQQSQSGQLHAEISLGHLQRETTDTGWPEGYHLQINIFADQDQDVPLATTTIDALDVRGILMRSFIAKQRYHYRILKRGQPNHRIVIKLLLISLLLIKLLVRVSPCGPDFAVSKSVIALF